MKVVAPTLEYIIPYKKNAVILYSSIRIYRNFANTRFSKYANREELSYIEKSINNTISKDTYRYIKTTELNNNEVNDLKDYLLINKNIKDSSIYIDNNKSIIVNLDEHIIIQVISNSLNIVKSYKEAKKEEEKISKHIEFAFDKELGFLTSTPKKVGCSMSVLIAFMIPASLTFAVNILQSIENRLKENGFVIKIKDNILYIRNKSMIGLSEKEIIRKADYFARYIEKIEVNIQKRLCGNYDLRLKLEDKIFRAYAILKNAKLLSYKEAIKYLMWISRGESLSIIRVDKKTIYELIFFSKDSQVKKYLSKDAKTKNIREYRAKLIQKSLKTNK